MSCMAFLWERTSDIAKPFSLKTLLARIEAVFAAARGGAPLKLRHRPLVWISIRPGREVRVDGSLVELTYTEFELH